MIRSRLKIFISFTFILLIGCSSTCKLKEELITETIEAINHRNTNGYIALFDFNDISRIWKEAGETENEYNEFLDFFENNNEKIIKAYSMSYNMVIGKIERVYKIKNYHFDLLEYNLLETKKEPNYISEKYQAKLKDNYGDNWSLIIFISKYKDCYLLTEPIDYNYFEKMKN